MKTFELMALAGLLAATGAWALPADGLHPNSDAWHALFAPDLSNAEDTKGVWFRDAEGNLTASKDMLLFSKAEYGPFILDLEFKFDPGANSGVYIYASDLKNLVPNKIEVQLMDDPAPCWKDCTPYQRNAALYGHCKPKASALKPTGEWNRMTIFARGAAGAHRPQRCRGDRREPLGAREQQDQPRRLQGAAAPHEAMG